MPKTIEIVKKMREAVHYQLTVLPDKDQFGSSNKEEIDWLCECEKGLDAMIASKCDPSSVRAANSCVRTWYTESGWSDLELLEEKKGKWK